MTAAIGHIIFIDLGYTLCEVRIHRLVHRNRAGARDYRRSVSRGYVIEELLRGFGERGVGLGNEYERTLDDIAAVFDGLLGRSDSVYGQSLDGVLNRRERRVADGVRVGRDGGDDVSGRGQLLTVLAGALGAGDRLEAVARTASGFTTDRTISPSFPPTSDQFVISPV